jgi:hypothetical protein
VKILTGGEARKQAFQVFNASRLGEIPGPMVARKRAPNHQIGLGESPDGKRLKLARPKIIFGFFY